MMHHGSVTNVVFKLDNCGPHHAKSIKSYLDPSIISVMKLPAQSPNLNPIENTWSYLEMKIRSRQGHSKNADELFNTLQEEWSAVPDDYFTNLIRLMRKRFNIVVENKAGSAKY